MRNMFNTITNHLKSRKFFLAFIGLQIVAGALALGQIDGLVFRDMSLGILGLYFGSNVADSFVEHKDRTPRQKEQKKD